MGLDGSSSDEDMPQRGPADSNDEDSPDEDFVASQKWAADDDMLTQRGSDRIQT